MANTKTQPGVSALPGFAESLRILVEDEHYSLFDIAAMFNVSKTRIQQLCDKVGVRRRFIQRGALRGLQAYRIWDDAANRFVPVPRRVGLRMHRHARNAIRVAAIAAKREERRAAMIATIQGLAKELQRTPTVSEMASAVLGRHVAKSASQLLAGHWGLTPKKGSKASVVCAHIAMRAGLYLRSVGGAGHLSHGEKHHRRRRTVVRRCSA